MIQEVIRFAHQPLEHWSAISASHFAYNEKWSVNFIPTSLIYGLSCHLSEPGNVIQLEANLPSLPAFAGRVMK